MGELFSDVPAAVPLSSPHQAHLADGVNDFDLYFGEGFHALPPNI